MTKLTRSQSLEKSLSLVNLLILGTLLIFGANFSKLHVYGPLYFHDLLLFTAAAISLLLGPKKFPFSPVLIILFISAGYLVYSFYHYDVGYEIIIRQFSLFAYLGCNYLLNRNEQPDYLALIKNFLIGFSVLSVVLQASYVFYVVAQGKFHPSDFNNHYWYSHAAILGLIIASALVLVYLNNTIAKCIASAFIFMLGWTTGHASAQLAIMAVVVIFVVLKLRSWKRLIPIMLGIIITLVLVKVAPQFKDRNTDWRLLTWGYILNDLTKNHYAVTGNGFGAPYTDHDLEMYLFREISSTALQERGRPDERYISPSHNSFITIFFAIGILPGLLIFYPYRYTVQYFTNDYREGMEFQYLMLLSLLGATIWCSFNVVLELPHSSGVFWLLYFTFWKLGAWPLSLSGRKETSALPRS